MTGTVIRHDGLSRRKTGPAGEACFCVYCGMGFPAAAGWPRTCNGCGRTSFRNPLPVTIVLIPVGSGVLTVRRAIEPHRGKLALPGGYIDYGETWQAAGAREAWEEAGVRIDPAQMRLVEVFSAPDATLIIAGRVPALAPDQLPAFVPNAESSERVILSEVVELAFPLHTDLLRQYLADSTC